MIQLTRTILRSALTLYIPRS